MPARTPKYQVIADDLTTKIKDGELPAGSALPPQKELSARYGVTLATLRQALKQLEDEGLLSQEPGRGTFVYPRIKYQLTSLHGFAEDLRDQGQTVTTEILDQSIGTPPDWAALIGQDEALRLERVRLVGGRPAVHQLSWVRGTELVSADLSDLSLYAALIAKGRLVHRATEVVRPGLLAEPAAGLLRRPPGEPVLVSERVTYALDGSALVVDRATMLGSAMEIRTERAATGLSVQWSRPSA
ncbi:Mannosyl-D-glycerate transport/metabolism system repressor mngR [Actinoplanes sp. SE50]|uniref:GntR family transcriptional regulator n=1 Tax=unclassified Actinoplanes TaxID=2626549 RepID=UPI00023ED419|nr:MULTISPECIES: GntR family transcriptional regulator [unclassified Actinoplanes]AEV83918.1 Mannosyl-D-glycerate transport/metabolism system repressor mngR [Actinoplanes sp. SE50/110]ATO81938.1 Mannosyl-D-glycerate transport/metabolism system repressor mngR [Actinoplanes sp. SE50]SLL99346.1 GntR family transcriptional regulator [Actinoplanes sp. SE50/110]